MKKILVLNSGSTTVKYQLFNMDGESHQVVAKGMAERIGISGSRVSMSVDENEKLVKDVELHNHIEAIKEVLNMLLAGPIKSVEEIDAVGHRMGHGGEYFDKSVAIDEDVLAKAREAGDLLPLHGAAFLYGIDAITELLPKVKQVATFDSSFHQSMKKEAFLYAIPLEQYEKHKIRRYGFHGTSHKYVAEEAAKMLGYKGKFISCHLGGGASVTAIENGRSVDTSMGFTPMAGMIMGTRCGDIDPYIPLHIMKTQNMTADEVNAMLNKESGWYGLTRGYTDLRDIEELYLEGNQDAITAVDVYVHALIKYIGAYLAVLGGVDAIIFTAGIGENSSFIRKKVCERLGFLGIELNEEANHIRGRAAEITTPSSKVKVLVIPTNEELLIAKDTYSLLDDNVVSIARVS